MSDTEVMTQVMERVSRDPAARKQLATAIGTGRADEVQRAAAGIGVVLSGERAAQLAASVRSAARPGYLFLT